MRLDEIVAVALSAIELSPTLAMVLGGFLMGSTILWLTPAIRAPRMSVKWALFVLTAFGVVFFVDRGAALYFDGNRLWPRNIGFMALWAAYAVSIACGIELRRRWAHIP